MDLEARLQRLGLTGPMGGYKLALLLFCLGVLALWMAGSIALVLLAAFGGR